MIETSASYTDERTLVTALVANERAAWDLFVSRYQPLIEGVARRTLQRLGAHDPDGLSGDVASEVFAELVANERRALTRFRHPWSFKGWLSVVASRRARRVLQRHRRQPGGMEEPEHIRAKGRSPASEVGRIEDSARVRQHIEQLKPRDRLALQLFYEGGRSYKEVAEILNLPVGRVGTVLARARTRLQRLLEG